MIPPVAFSHLTIATLRVICIFLAFQHHRTLKLTRWLTAKEIWLIKQYHVSASYSKKSSKWIHMESWWVKSYFTCLRLIHSCIGILRSTHTGSTAWACRGVTASFLKYLRASLPTGSRNFNDIYVHPHLQYRIQRQWQKSFLPCSAPWKLPSDCYQ